MVDALAPRERKTWVNCDKPRGVVNRTLIRGFLKGKPVGFLPNVPQGIITTGTETSQYRQEEKAIAIP